MSLVAKNEIGKYIVKAIYTVDDGEPQGALVWVGEKAHDALLNPTWMLDAESRDSYNKAADAVLHIVAEHEQGAVHITGIYIACDDDIDWWRKNRDESFWTGTGDAEPAEEAEPASDTSKMQKHVVKVSYTTERGGELKTALYWAGTKDAETLTGTAWLQADEPGKTYAEAFDPLHDAVRQHEGDPVRIVRVDRASADEIDAWCSAADDDGTMGKMQPILIHYTVDCKAGLQYRTYASLMPAGDVRLKLWASRYPYEAEPWYDTDDAGRDAYDVELWELKGMLVHNDLCAEITREAVDAITLQCWEPVSWDAYYQAGGLAVGAADRISPALRQMMDAAGLTAADVAAEGTIYCGEYYGPVIAYKGRLYAYDITGIISDIGHEADWEEVVELRTDEMTELVKTYGYNGPTARKYSPRDAAEYSMQAPRYVVDEMRRFAAKEYRDKTPRLTYEARDLDAEDGCLYDVPPYPVDALEEAAYA